MSGHKIIVAQPPCFFTEAELQDFIALILAGGEVDDIVLKNNVCNAKCLVFLRQGGCLSGVAALKNPLQSYRQKISKKAGVLIDTSEFPFELGYIFVLPSARRQGFSVELTNAALSAAEGKGVFATSHAKNEHMHATLDRSGFIKSGCIYASSKGNRDLQLFLRPAA